MPTAIVPFATLAPSALVSRYWNVASPLNVAVGVKVTLPLALTVSVPTLAATAGEPDAVVVAVPGNDPPPKLAMLPAGAPRESFESKPGALRVNGVLSAT